MQKSYKTEEMSCLQSMQLRRSWIGQGAYILGDVAEDRDGMHLLPVIVLGPQVGQEDGGDEGCPQTEAAARQRRVDLLEGGGVKHAVLDVGLHKPCSHSQPLAQKGSCTQMPAE